VSILAELQRRTNGALKAGRKDEVGALRVIVSELQKATKDGGVELDHEGELKVLRRELKRHHESLEAFRAGGRADLVAKEEFQVALLEGLLPKNMGEAALAALVDAVIAELGATSPKDTGSVMSAVMNRGGGQADGRLASRLVKERLSP
jgi:uncharacterized protein YqeY